MYTIVALFSEVLKLKTLTSATINNHRRRCCIGQRKRATAPV